MVRSADPIKLLFFWDYDTQWGADRSRSGGGAKDWGVLDFENTEQALALHAEYDLPACFAVVGAAARPGLRPYHDPDQIRRIHQSGHEIASHSLCHDWLPGLDRANLRATLRESKDALEECIGSAVVSFVPPYNQPFDFAERGSISVSERRAVGRHRTALRDLCEALNETGYRFCRVAYRPWHTRLSEAIFAKRINRLSRIESIAGVCCVRLNTPGGFRQATTEMLERTGNGYVVVYGHPHSATSGNSQDFKYLIPFFQKVRELRSAGKLQVMLPKDVLETVRNSEPQPSLA